MLSAITAILGGGASGLLGSLFTGILGYLNKRQDQQHALAVIRAETAAMTAEAEAQIRVTEKRVEGDIALAEMGAFTESQKQGNRDAFRAEYMAQLMAGGRFCQFAGAMLALAMGMVDVLRHSARPVLTYYQVGATTWITWLAWSVLIATETAMSVAFAQEIFGKVVTTVLYLTVTCVTWWFGDRRVAKIMMESDARRTAG